MNEAINKTLRTVEKGIAALQRPSATDLEKAAVDTSKPVSKTILSTLGNAALDVGRIFAPRVTGLIEKALPIVKAISKNDDEWFSEFKVGGATFNEWLEVAKREQILVDTVDPDQTEAIRQGIPSIMVSLTSINESEGFTDQFMPSVLAYVRNKTNNVLADDTALYTGAFVSAANLMELYYQGLKYIKLSERQPLNIPLLPSALEPLLPSQYSTFKGIVEALGNYIKSSIRLPYALNEYIRWRFGTVFHSSNTGKPGLVLYDRVTPFVIGDLTATGYTQVAAHAAPKGMLWGSISTSSNFIDQYDAAVEYWKTQYKAAGRAGADLFVAYQDHTQRHDVEDAHYDEKEYNLRTNAAYVADQMMNDNSANCYGYIVKGDQKLPSTKNVVLYMDSRLDSSAAFQAITMSCNVPNAVFPIWGAYVGFYTPSTVNADYQSVEDGWTAKQVLMTPGWYWGALYQNRITNFTRGGGRPLIHQSADAIALAAARGGTDAPNDGTQYLYAFSGTRLPVLIGRHAITQYGSEPALTQRAVAFMAEYIANRYADALQLHVSGHSEMVINSLFVGAMLSYDMAYVTTETVVASNRTAIRNLVRGDYKNKRAVGDQPEVRSAAATLETAAVKAAEAKL